MDDSAPLLHVDWIRWLEALKVAVETPISLSAEQVTGGVFPIGLIPDIPWDKVLKAGSSLGELETRNATALTMSADRLLGRTTAGTGAVEEISVAGGLTLAAGVLTSAALTGVILADGSVPFTADQSMGGFALTDVDDPVDAQDAATKAYVDATASATVRGEVPTGAVNGSNTVYTTAADYGTDLAVYRNGVRQLKTTDYTETTATTFTMLVAPLTGDLLQVDYNEAGGGGGGGGGAGALVLLEEHIGSASASLDFTTAITSSYDEYLIEFVNLVPTVNGAWCQLLVSTDGGSTWKTTDYQYGIRYFSPTGAAGVVNSTTDTSLFLLNNVPNVADGMSGSLRLFAPGGSGSKLFLGDVAGLETDSNRYWFSGAWWYANAAAVNALRVIFDSSSTVASGVVRMYGVAKV